nr:hypothetical protein [Tanacetum cinerariifolium]
ADEGTGIIPGVPDVPTEESDEEISWKLSDEDDDDDVDCDDQDNDDDQDTDEEASTPKLTGVRYKELITVITQQVASGAAPPKTNASVRKTKSSSDTSITPPTVAGTRLSTSTKGKQTAKASKAKNEGTGIIPGVPDVPTEESDEEISWKLSDKDDDDDDDVDCDDQDNDDDQDTDEEGEEFKHPKLSIHNEKETKDEESFDPIAKTPKNSDDEGNDDENLGLNVGSEEGYDAEDDEDKLYKDVNINLEGRVVKMADVHTTQEFKDTHVTLTSVNPDGINSLFETTSQMDVLAPTTVASLTLSTPSLTPSTIATISIVPQAPTPPTTAPRNLLQDLPNFGSLFGFDHRLKTLKANFSEFVQANQFAGAVSSILGIVQRYMDQWMNEQSRNLDENTQKIIKEQVKEQVKIRIEKIEGNKSIHRSDEKRNLYKALVEAYESDKIILDTYGDIVTLKRRLDDDADKDEEPFAGSDRGSKRRREGKEPESTCTQKEKATRITGKSTQGSKSQQKTTSESAPAEEPMQTTHDLEEPSYQEFEIGAAYNQPIAEASQHPEWFRQQKKPPTPDPFLMNRLNTLTLELLAGPTYELMKGSSKSLVELEFFLKEVYKIVKWNNYKHLDWITVRRDDEKLYKFKEGDFKRLRIQDIEDMLLLVVQGKLTNLTVKEHFTFNVSLRMFTRSIVIQRRVEDLQLGVESYQKKLNLTRPDTYRSDLKRKEAYIAYSSPKGFIYQNKDKQNRLMWIDKLHKFNDGMLNDVRTTLDDRLKGIQMKYLPQTI